MRDHRRTAYTALALWFGVVGAGALSPAAAAAQDVEVTAAPEPASQTVTEVANWAAAAGDAHGLPFMIIDKVAAEVFVYDANGQPQGAAPALLGLALDDASAPGIGERPLSSIDPSERVTPAGRFLAGFGRAKGATDVLWVDYASAISIHPVVTSNPAEQRLARLKSSFPQDRRITYGCINVSFDFYERVVRPTFLGTPGVVYILPEALPLDEVFPTLRLQAPAQPQTQPPQIQAPAQDQIQAQTQDQTRDQTQASAAPPDDSGKSVAPEPPQDASAAAAVSSAGADAGAVAAVAR